MSFLQILVPRKYTKAHMLLFYLLPILIDLNTGAPLLGGEGEVLPSPFLKKEKELRWFCKNSVLFVCIYGLNSHSKCSFQSILEKKEQNLSLQCFFCISYMKRLSKCPYSKKLPLSQKAAGCAPEIDRLIHEYWCSVKIFCCIIFCLWY